MKWSKRQRKAIQKVIKRYQWVLKDLQSRYIYILDSDSCAFCQMYQCGGNTKCPSAFFTNNNHCMSHPLLVRLQKNLYNYNHCKKGSEKWLRKAIQARMEFWQEQLKEGEK